MENEVLTAIGGLVLGGLIAAIVFVARNWIYWVEARGQKTDRDMRRVKDRLRRADTSEGDFSWLDETDE